MLTLFLHSLVQPILKTEINHKTSRSKCISSSNKSECIAAISSKKKESAASCPENMPLVAHEEVTQGEPSPDSNNKSAADNKSNVITIRKSSRRRSYTSLLMTGSKV
jgi:cyclin B